MKVSFSVFWHERPATSNTWKRIPSRGATRKPETGGQTGEQTHETKMLLLFPILFLLCHGDEHY
jgi:hypothetical protein